MPLGSYLLFIGIFTSARTLSQDGQLRKEFYKSAESHLALLKTIGVTEMERLLEKKYKYVIDRISPLMKDGDTNLEQQNIKEIIHDVLNELNSNKKLGIRNDDTNLTNDI